MKKRVFKYIFITVLSAVLILLLSVFLIKSTAGVVLGIALALVAGYIGGKIFSKKLASGIEGIDPDEVDPDECDIELKPLLRKIVRQEALISRQMRELRRHQEEFRAITENMAEGLIVSDKSGEIILSNTHARSMLLNGGDPKNVFDFSDAESFIEPVKAALNGNTSQSDLIMPGRIYRIYANPLISESKPVGAVVLILDKTEEELRESMRREFTSNVSHELKTPLTSIYGISEILAEGIVKGEDIPKFAKSIYDETGRLITLVNDIIKLSQMDENSIMEEKEPVDVFEISKNVGLRLEKVAAKKNIVLNVTGFNACIFGIKGIIEEMIYNLADNGIKYNVEGGRVEIAIDKRDDRVTVSVKDTGIGISNEHIGRIFERFYRVDKSHSKQVGGTGLGLSIVKHGASFHGALIDVQSAPLKGTEIKLSFPEYEK